MARIAGIDLPSNKKVEVGLTYIYGIGPHFAKCIMEEANIPENKRVFELTTEEITSIRKVIDAKYTVEGNLRRQVAMDIKRITDLGCYKGLRHRKKLPVRGQRTHTNARTRKGKAIPIAGKKIATLKK